jgi:hypothetical protein
MWLQKPIENCMIATMAIEIENDRREIRTPNLLIWSQTRYRCAIQPTTKVNKLPTEK